MRKIAVIFPGVGYKKDRPLLYYAGKIAANCGYELRFIEFSEIEWSKEKLKDHDFLLKTLEKCLNITGKTLEDTGDLSGDEVVFISKSIGTVVATAYEKKRSLSVKQICFSPLEMIDDYVREKGAVLFCADSDPYADYNTLDRIAKEKKLEIQRVSGGNHSLETGDVFTDLDNMKSMMQRVAEVITDVDIYRIPVKRMDIKRSKSV